MPEAPSGSQPGDADPTAEHTVRSRVHDILEQSPEAGTAGAVVNGAIVVLIVANVVAFAAETIPDLGRRYGRAFELFNLVSVALFTLEYVLRLWSCVEISVLSQMPAAKARLRFALRPLQLIDLAAVLPFYLSLFLPIDLRVLRVLRLFRFLKLARYSPALYSLGRVIANERRALVGALLVMLSLLLFAATGLYFIERNVQPEVFGSIPSAAWWALATLTTVGYGDVVPITPVGKLFGGLIMIFGLGMFALPVAIVATGFSQETNRREFMVTWGMVARVPLFARLQPATLTQIMVLLYARSYEAGARIVRIGDPADAMFFITAGEVVVDGDAGPVTLGEGDFFGEMALIENRLREHNVTAATRCRLLVFDKEDFEALCHREPDIMDHVRAVAASRQAAARAEIAESQERD